MKKYLVLFSILFTVQILAQEYQDYKWLHEKPQGNTLRWVKMWDANNWYALGASGVFMKTTDAGQTWYFHQKAGRPRIDGSTSFLYDAHFFDMNNGVVGGTDGLMRTTNGGVTFDTVTTNVAGTIYQLYFLNSQIGYAAGLTVKLAKTTDGGLTWVQNATIPTGTCYDAWTPNDTLIIAASTSGNIRRSTDGGLTWTSILTGASATLYKVEFSDNLNGWVAGTVSAARYTTDAGLTWTSANTGLPASSTFYDMDLVPQAPTLQQGFEDVAFPPTGWQAISVLGTAVWNRSTAQFHSGTASAYISYQGTGGEDWLITPKIAITANDDISYYLRKYYTTSYPPDSIYIMVSTTDSALTSFSPLFGIDVNALTNSAWDGFITDLSAYAGQNIYIAFKHIDFDGNGVYLDDVVIGPPNPAKEVWLTGIFGDLWHSSNMGTTWTSTSIVAPSATWTSTHYATDFLNGSILSVGAFGIIDLKVGTADPVTFTTFKRGGTLYDVYGEHGGKIIAVGSPTSAGSSYDQIMISTDAGATWTFGITNDQPVNTTGPVAIEEQTEIIETKDNPVVTPTSTSTFRSIQMFNQTTGYVVGSNGAIYKTTNGGTNWDSVVTTIPVTATLYKIDFINPTTGWVFDNTSNASGTIWKTTDGMTTWTQQILTGQTTSNTRIYGADMVDANYGWCVNYKPRPYKTTDGGATWTEQPLSDAYGGFLYDIQMIDTSLGYCCGGGGRFYKTTDGGTMWTVMPTPVGTSPSFYDLDFFDANIGLVTGSLGVVLSTSDGGTTWQVENTAGSNTNYAAYMVMPAEALDTAAVLIVGSNGSVFKENQFVVPVELTSFTANVNVNSVTLNWSTATEVNNRGFDIERASNNNWEKIGFVAGRGTSTELQSYTFTDANLPAGKYNYRIKQIDFDGTYEYYNLSEVVEISVPDQYELSQNYPNPFNPSTTINYSLAESGPVTLKIYNILGKEILTLVNGYQEAGRYSRVISLSELGNLSSGVYFYSLDAGNFTQTRKMMILK